MLRLASVAAAGRSIVLVGAALGVVFTTSGARGEGDAARVLFTSGAVSVVSPGGETRAAARRASIRSGESVTTADGSVQLELADGALLSLAPHSALRVDDFRLTTRADGAGVAYFSLERGALRFAAGRRASRFADRYRLRTAAADVVIRDAVFSARLCRGDCEGAGFGGMVDGLHLVVDRGEIMVFNAAGSVTAGPRRRVQVRDYRSRLRAMVADPGDVGSLLGTR